MTIKELRDELADIQASLEGADGWIERTSEEFANSFADITLSGYTAERERRISKYIFEAGARRELMAGLAARLKAVVEALP